MNRLLIFIALLPASGSTQSIRDLDFLIGTWDLHEVTYPGTPKEYIETGKRTCEYVLLGNYIRCESKAIRHGKDRIYVNMINYLKEEKAFQMISMFSDFPQQGKYRLQLDQANKRIDITSLPGHFDDESLSRSVITFSEPGKLVWEGWSSSFNGPPAWTNLYKETATKAK